MLSPAHNLHACRKLSKRAQSLQSQQQLWAAERAAIITQMSQLAEARAELMHDTHSATEAQVALAQQQLAHSMTRHLQATQSLAENPVLSSSTAAHGDEITADSAQQDVQPSPAELTPRGLEARAHAHSGRPAAAVQHADGAARGQAAGNHPYNEPAHAAYAEEPLQQPGQPSPRVRQKQKGKAKKTERKSAAHHQQQQQQSDMTAAAEWTESVSEFDFGEHEMLPETPASVSPRRQPAGRACSALATSCMCCPCNAIVSLPAGCA